jgi:hypothetical protein
VGNARFTSFAVALTLNNLFFQYMKNILSVALACVMVFGFTYGFAYKPEDGKLHCKVCSGTHFVASRKYTKFVGKGDNRILKSASFFQCSKCGNPTDIVVD